MSATRTVLRVKRRRTEDPFQALLVQHSAGKKRRRADSLGPEVNDEGKYIFKFAGTFGDGKDVSQERLLEKLSSQKELEAGSEFSERQQQLIEGKRLSRMGYDQNSTKACPFRIIGNSRITDARSPQSSSLASKEVDHNENVIEIYDIVSDSAANVANNKVLVGNKKTVIEKEDTDTIMCNSVKMIHEKLKISDDSEIEDADYVYDLYYANERKIDSENDLLYIQTLDQDVLYDFEINGQLEDDEICDDCDEDSNDENNWRNDYPDEDDVYSSDENENSHSNSDNESSSSLEEGNMFSDYRSSAARMRFDPYYIDESESYNYEAYDDAYGQDDDDYDYDIG